MSTTPSFVAGKFDRVLYPDSTGPALGPVWTEQHGSAAAVDSLRDSISYDGWERVIAVVTRKNGAVATRDTFQFTRTGNLRMTAGAETYDGTTDRLTSRAASGCGATWSYTYDRAGNLVTAVCGTTTWTYQYDALNQLRAVRYNATLIARYTYDVLGRRIAKRVYSTSTGGTVAYTRFVYHAAHVAFEADSAGSITLRYTWGLGTDDLLAIRDAAGNHYYAVQDVLGSVRGLVKRDGTWARSLRYGPYGAVVADTAGAAAPSWELRYRWTGREYDVETGFYYFRARYYEPAVRRFVQQDPIGYGAGSNVYAYGEGGPLETRDPSGLRSSPMEILCGGCVLGGGGGGGFNFSSSDEFNGGWDPWGQETDQEFEARFGLTPLELRALQSHTVSEGAACPPALGGYCEGALIADAGGCDIHAGAMAANGPNCGNELISGGRVVGASITGTAAWGPFGFTLSLGFYTSGAGGGVLFSWGSASGLAGSIDLAGFTSTNGLAMRGSSEGGCGGGGSGVFSVGGCDLFNEFGTTLVGSAGLGFPFEGYFTNTYTVASAPILINPPPTR